MSGESERKQVKVIICKRNRFTSNSFRFTSLLPLLKHVISSSSLSPVSSFVINPSQGVARGRGPDINACVMSFI